MRAGRVDTVQLKGDFRRLVGASAYHSRSLTVELAQVRQRLGIARIQLHSLFELGARPLGQVVCAEEVGPIRDLSQSAAVPQVIVRVFRFDGDSLFTLAI